MNSSKQFASLSPTLLARKGGAKPAMRPQVHPLPQHFNDAAAREVDDLGWNDMGEDRVEAPALQPQGEVVPFNGAVQSEPAKPAVLREREGLAGTISRLDRPRRSALAEGRRAAFTLRLDSERHLKLRLACTIDNRSAQQVVTEALDRLLADMPEVAALAERVRQRN